MKFMSKANKIKHFIKEQVLFTSFDGSQRTELSGEHAKNKEEIFDYIHTYCREDLLNILYSFTDIKVLEKVLPIVDEIYEEGIIIRYLSEGLSIEKPVLEIGTETNDDTDNILFLQQHKNSQTVFVPFRINGVPPDERFYSLSDEAEIRQGILPEINEGYYFTVTETKKITKNMLRIFIKSDVELSTNSPGLAYRFILNTMDEKTKLLNSLPFKTLEKIKKELEGFPFLEKKTDKVIKQGAILVFEIFKRLPKKSEEAENNNPTETTEVDKKAGRFYTLRQLKNATYDRKSNKSYYYGEVDIYLHEETAGSIWAKSLKKGDIIYSNYEYEETIKDMTVGQALLICDETSMPSVASVLEQWQSPVTPIVISITNDSNDFKYFDDCQIADCIKKELEIVHIVPESQKDIAPMVIKHIQKVDKQIDCAWGAIGASQVKPIKKYLREKYHLKGKLNRVRAYWS